MAESNFLPPEVFQTTLVEMRFVAADEWRFDAAQIGLNPETRITVRLEAGPDVNGHSSCL